MVGIGQVRSRARSAYTEHAVLVDPDEGTDRGAPGKLEPGERLVEVG
jgi:hypothetical protein